MHSHFAPQFVDAMRAWLLPAGAEPTRAPATHDGHMDDAYRVERRRLHAARVPLAYTAFLLFGLLATGLELLSYPTRRRSMLASFAACAFTCVATLVLVGRRPQWSTAVTVVANNALISFIAAYYVSTQGAPEACALTLVLLLANFALLSASGGGAHSLSCLGALVSYSIVLWAGAKSELPISYNMAVILGAGGVTVLGVHIFDRQRRAAFYAPTTSSQGPLAHSAPPSALNSFQLSGEFWTIHFKGTVCLLPRLKGLAHLAQLLRHPNRDLPATYLLCGGNSSEPTPRLDPADFESNVTVATKSSAIPMIDERGLREFYERLAALEEYIDEAVQLNDRGLIEKLRAEKASLQEELSAVVRWDGKPREFVSKAEENARLAVTKSVRNVIARIATSHPNLGRHLATHIKTGYLCSYRPDPADPIDWET